MGVRGFGSKMSNAALRYSALRFDRYGSKRQVGSLERHVPSTLNSRRRWTAPTGPVRASSGNALIRNLKEAPLIRKSVELVTALIFEL